jgi:hypothetical protein
MKIDPRSAMMSGMENFAPLHLLIVCVVVLLLCTKTKVIHSLAERVKAARVNPLNPRAQRWTMIYGMLLINALILIDLLSNPEHRVRNFFSSWQNFLLFVAVGAVAVFTARAIAIRQFPERE